MAPTTSSVVDRFRQVDVAGYPDVHLLESDLDVVLWVLLVASERLSIDRMTAAQVADVATFVEKRALSRQAVASLLLGAKGLVARAGRSTPATFMLMKPGAQRVRAVQSAVFVIDPVKAFSSQQRVDQMMGSLTGEVLVCDPYFDERVLLVLEGVPPGAQVKFLTSRVQEEEKTRRKFDAFSKQYGNLEVRRSATKDLHDRYIIDATGMLLVGHSLNSIGTKQTFVVSMGEDIRAAMEVDFRSRWNGATIWK